MLVDNLLGQEQAGTLSAQLSVAARRKDDLPQHVVEILNADRVLGNVDEAQAFGEKAPNQGDANALLRGQREFVLVNVRVPITLQSFDNVAERRIQLFQRAQQETAFFLLDPCRDTSQNLVVAEVLASHTEHLVGELGRTAVGVGAYWLIFSAEDRRLNGVRNWSAL